MTRIVHWTSAHAVHDSRIFQRQCCSLAKSGFDVWLVASGEKSTATANGVRIVTVGAVKNRFDRILINTFKVSVTAWKLRGDLYHFHDPELLPYALIFKFFGKTVVYDMHEDTPAQIFNKGWIPYWLRSTISRLYRSLERIALPLLPCIFVEETFPSKYPEVKVNTLVKNFPDTEALDQYYVPFSERPNTFNICYIGAIHQDRYFSEMLEAMFILYKKNLDFRFSLVGKIPANLLPQLDLFKKKIPKEHLVIKGYLPLNSIMDDINKCHLGLCLLKPIKNYINSYPTKIYEYMALGIPFLGSDLPRMKVLAEEYKVGSVISTLEASDIAKTIEELMNTPEQLKQMSKAARNHRQDFGWQNEFKSLLKFYKSLGITSL